MRGTISFRRSVLVVVATLTAFGASFGCSRGSHALPAAPSVPLATGGGAPLVEIAISADTSTLTVGQTLQLKATATFSDRTQADVTSQVVWETGNAGVAKVSATGLLTAIGVGACKVLAAHQGITAELGLEVRATSGGGGGCGSCGGGGSGPTVVRLKILGNTSLIVGAAAQLTALATLSDGNTIDVTAKVAWGPDRGGIVLVSATGLLTAIGPGDCGVLATFEGITARLDIHVSAKAGGTPTVVGVKIIGNSSLIVAATAQLKAVAVFSDGNEVDVTASVGWGPDRPGIITVSATGLVTAIGAGDCGVLAIFQGITARLDVHVSLGSPGAPAVVVGLTIIGNTNLGLGLNAQLKAIATMSDGTQVDVTGAVTWRTSNSLVAIVSTNGLVTAIGLGTCDVIAVHAGFTARLSVRIALL